MEELRQPLTSTRPKRIDYVIRKVLSGHDEAVSDVAYAKAYV
jgi:hypothetical protein